jgi:hypothetical protein
MAAALSHSAAATAAYRRLLRAASRLPFERHAVAKLKRSVRLAFVSAAGVHPSVRARALQQARDCARFLERLNALPEDAAVLFMRKSASSVDVKR